MQLDSTEVKNYDVQSWKGLHLLHFDASPSSQKVRILLNEKRIHWISHHVDLRKREHVSTWFLGINPRGVVPVLVHDGMVHVESDDIMEYVDGLPSERAPFYPRPADARARVREELAFHSSLRFSTRALAVGFLAPTARHLRNREALDAYRRNGTADLSRAIEIAWWQDTVDRGVSRDRLIESFVLHRRAFAELEDRLQHREWLHGNRISVLDIAWFTTIHQLEVLGYDLSRHPYLSSYYQRLMLRPAFRQELQIRGPLKIIAPAYRLYRRITGMKLEKLAAD